MKPLNQQLHKGEAAAFAELYDQLGEKLFRYIYCQVGSSQDASDVVQEVFVRLVKSHRSLARADNLSGYVFATARNETIRWLKKKNGINRETSTRRQHKHPNTIQPNGLSTATNGLTLS